MIPNQSQELNFSIPINQTDIDFINYIQSEITEDGLLPFTLPVQSLPRIIRDSALWFYRECADSTIEQWYGIKYNDIKKDANANAFLKLNDNIESVMDLKQVESSNGFGTLARFMREPIMYMNSMNSLGAGGSATQGLGNPYRMADRDASFEESFARMYEYSTMKTLMKKGLLFDFNPFSKTINFLGRVDGDIVLHTLTRIPLNGLYADIRFRRYVTACCLIKLKKILNMFGFTYPGNVTINFDELSETGTEMKKEIEEEIRKDSDASDIILKK